MRSRYTAFATHEVDYLIASHHPDTRGEVDRDEAKRFSEDATWLGLDILSTDEGQEGDEQGWVEFMARYKEAGEERVHHERSLFRRYQGRWFFHSSQQPRQTPTQRAQPKIGRNEPCSCGSGKKYKKCCGVAA
jgi:SEC-C motif-containing protein